MEDRASSVGLSSMDANLSWPTPPWEAITASFKLRSSIDLPIISWNHHRWRTRADRICCARAVIWRITPQILHARTDMKEWAPPRIDFHFYAPSPFSLPPVLICHESLSYLMYSVRIGFNWGLQLSHFSSSCSHADPFFLIQINLGIPIDASEYGVFFVISVRNPHDY